jgi:hypothetical protein
LMYASLGPDDYSDGGRVERAFAAIGEGELPQANALGNAFERPLYERFPALRDLSDGMRALGAERVGLSGAGPAHFALETDPDRARALAHLFLQRFGDEALVYTCWLVPHGARVETAASKREIARWFEQHDASDPAFASAGTRDFDHNMPNPVEPVDP